MTAATVKRPSMTADEARSFDRFSVGNAARVTAALEARGCERRGTWNIGAALLCGIHKRRALTARNHQIQESGLGILAMLTPADRDSILQLAKGER